MNINDWCGFITYLSLNKKKKVHAILFIQTMDHILQSNDYLQYGPSTIQNECFYITVKLDNSTYFS